MSPAQFGGKRRRARRTKRRRGSKKARSTAKVGAKSNPYSSKSKAMKGRRAGVCYYKKKGRTLKLKK
tara:strand:- start:6044 stop:6244 length:201 start_codon:yes stop_codon:yes gene_type:complete